MCEKHKAGEKVSIVTNWEVERVGSRAQVIGEEALGSPVNKVDRVEGRSRFQSEGPMIAKAIYGVSEP